MGKSLTEFQEKPKNIFYGIPAGTPEEFMEKSLEKSMKKFLAAS